MGEKGKRDKGVKEDKKKPKHTLKEKRKLEAGKEASEIGHPLPCACAKVLRLRTGMLSQAFLTPTGKKPFGGESASGLSEKKKNPFLPKKRVLSYH